MNNSTINIPVLQFDLYELVTLYWNEQEQHTKVVRRWFDLEDDLWWVSAEIPAKWDTL
jgi:hypothetical protein